MIKYKDDNNSHPCDNVDCTECKKHFTVVHNDIEVCCLYHYLEIISSDPFFNRMTIRWE